MDWVAIESQAENLIASIDPFEIVSEAELEQFRLSKLTYGLIKSPLALKISYGHSVSVKGGSDEELRQSVLQEIAYEVGLSIHDEAQQAFPKIDHIEVIRRSIAKREVTTEFLLSWGHLHRIVAQYALLLSTEPDFSTFATVQSGGEGQSMRIQKHWYAHWIRANRKPEEPSDITVAQHLLGKVCLDIRNGRVKPWNPYPKEWFVRMLASSAQKKGSAEEDPWQLTVRFHRIGAAELNRLVNHPLITREVLPPLTAAAFKVP